MIQKEKYQQALQVLSGILTRARWMAHEANATQLAELLDTAEVLPQYIAEAEDFTEPFRVTVDDISKRHPNCTHLIDLFDRGTLQAS